MNKIFDANKNNFIMIGGVAIALMIFLGIMVYSSKAFASEEYWDVKIDGKTIAVVSSEDEGNAVIAGVKNTYVHKNAKVESITVDKEFKAVKHRVKAGTSPKISSVENVIKKITKGVKGQEKYKIQDGDTVWDIAYKNGLTYDEIVEMNKASEFNPEKIMPGDEIVINKMVPYINVTVKQIFDTNELIAPEVEYEEDSNMEAGEMKVKEEGEAGSKLVKLRQTSVNDTISEKESLEEKITKEAKKRIIIKGTKNADSEANSSVQGSGSGSSIAARAQALVGSHMDCVQLASNALSAAGIRFSGWPEQFFGLGATVQGGLAGAQPGDIIIYQYTNGVNGGAHYDHVAVYIGGGMAVHGGWNGDSVVVASASAGSGISVVRP
ncbi:G5 domain-containing protein [Eubacteriales bacterium KG127]